MGIPPLQVKSVCAMGTDVAFGMYDVSICTVERPKPGIVTLRLVFAGKVQDERQCKFLVEQYRVKSAVVDSRPDATIASRFQGECRRNHVKCYRAQYSTAPTNRRVVIDENEGLVTLDRTMTLDLVYQSFSSGLLAAIPQNYREINGGRFADEMCNANREPVVWHGLPTFAWKNPGDDHAMHSWAYMQTAVELGGMMMGSSEAMLPRLGQVVGTLGGEGDDDDEDDWDYTSREKNGKVVHVC